MGQAKKKLFSTIETYWALVRGWVIYHTHDVCCLPVGLTMPLLVLNLVREKKKKKSHFISAWAKTLLVLT